MMKRRVRTGVAFLLAGLLAVGYAVSAVAEITGEPACPALTLISAEGNALYPLLGEVGFHGADFDRNTLREKWEVTLIERVLCTETLPHHADLRTAYQANLAALRAETHYATDLQPYENLLAAVLLKSETSQKFFKEAMNLTGNYTVYRDPRHRRSPLLLERRL